MRPVQINQRRSINDFERWAEEAIEELVRASQDEDLAVADDFTVSNYTATTELDASTATTADIANFVCTLVAAMKARRIKRAQ